MFEPGSIKNGVREQIVFLGVVAVGVLEEEADLPVLFQLLQLQPLEVDDLYWEQIVLVFVDEEGASDELHVDLGRELGGEVVGQAI